MLALSYYLLDRADGHSVQRSTIVCRLLTHCSIIATPPHDAQSAQNIFTNKSFFPFPLFTWNIFCKLLLLAKGYTCVWLLICMAK